MVGLTGGIGSGKSTVSDMFTALGVSIVDADLISRKLVIPGSDTLRQITEHFGIAILQNDGSLDRKALRKLVFADAGAREWLEALLHPMVREEVLRYLAGITFDWVILSAPLLLESGMQDICDRILVVDVEEKTQIQRTRQRDNSTAAEVTTVMGTQLGRAERLALADDIISNEGSLRELQEQVSKLKQSYDDTYGKSHHQTG